MRQARLKIGDSGPRGRGVFAGDIIPKGSEVVRYRGRPKWIWDIPKGKWSHCFQYDYDRYLVPRKGAAGWYINHSCDPNCVIKGKRSVVTNRTVSEGEELTFDYSTNVGWRDYAMECLCGSKDCRGVVRSYSKLSKDQKKRYGRNISAFLLSTPRVGKKSRPYSRTSVVL